MSIAMVSMVHPLQENKETPESISTDINWLHTLGVCFPQDNNESA
jgi:hypothetical protein